MDLKLHFSELRELDWEYVSIFSLSQRLTLVFGPGLPCAPLFPMITSSQARDCCKVKLMIVQGFGNLGQDMLREHWILFLIYCFKKAETGDQSPNTSTVSERAGK